MYSNARTPRSFLHALHSLDRRRWLIGGATMGGGALIIAGTLLPWVSLLAGLHPYAGTAGLNGQLLIGGGLLSIISGAWFLLAGSLPVRWAIGLLGFTLLAFASWLLIELLLTYRQLAADPLLVPRLGPGLFLVVLGSLLIFVTLLLGDD